MTGFCVCVCHPFAFSILQWGFGADRSCEALHLEQDDLIPDVPKSLEFWIFVILTAVTKEATASFTRVICLGVSVIVCRFCAGDWGLLWGFSPFSSFYLVAVFFSFLLTIPSRHPLLILSIHRPCLPVSSLFGWPGVTAPKCEYAFLPLEPV